MGRQAVLYDEERITEGEARTPPLVPTALMRMIEVTYFKRKMM
jgi:hypothetical protein